MCPRDCESTCETTACMYPRDESYLCTRERRASERIVARGEVCKWRSLTINSRGATLRAHKGSYAGSVVKSLSRRHAFQFLLSRFRNVDEESLRRRAAAGAEFIAPPFALVSSFVFSHHAADTRARGGYHRGPFVRELHCVKQRFPTFLRTYDETANIINAPRTLIFLYIYI